MNTFKFGIGDRGSSIRIPFPVSKAGIAYGSPLLANCQSLLRMVIILLPDVRDKQGNLYTQKPFVDCLMSEKQP